MSTAVIGPAFLAPRRHPARVAAPPMRLTRRGRLLLTLVFLGLALAAFTVFGSVSAATGEAGDPIPTRTVMVEEGDTLWGIASQVAKPGEVREVVHHIEELNALPGASVYVGQELAVPVG